jgi:hypothetical protein
MEYGFITYSIQSRYKLKGGAGMSNVVVLTKYWHFWGERSLRDAIRLIVKGKVEIIKADESTHIKTGISRSGVTFKIPAPLVIRLLEFGGYKIKRTDIRWSASAVFNRDNYNCQYYHYDEMGKKFIYKCSKEEATIDHVIPKCKGGRNTFENTVTSCRWHNVDVKRGRTPKEAKLKIVKKPTSPKIKKGDMAYIKFYFNPDNIAHRAFKEIMNY